MAIDPGLQFEAIPASYSGGYGSWGVEPVEAGTRADNMVRTATPRLSIIQDSHDHGHFAFAATNLDTEALVGAGEKLGGWAAFMGRLCLLTAVIRDVWRQYPFEFEFGDRVMRVNLWPRNLGPRNGRLLDLTWDGSWWFLNDRS